MGSDGEGRVFLRGITSESYGLGELRRRQREAPRVRPAGTVVDDASVGHSGDSSQSRTWWILGPGDDPFLTQTIQMHFVELFPGGANRGHGHQNEATFYILEGRGYEIHDGQRYDWEEGDFVVVHNDSVHRHFNADPARRAVAIVIKAKAAWMYLGLWQQGRGGPVVDGDRYGPPEDWSRLWTPGVTARKKVVKPSDAPWEVTRDGRVRVLCSPARTDVRVFSVDVYQQEIPGGSRSARHWHMADEALYVMAGRGYSLHWDVEAEIADRYYARVAREPSRWEFGPGDLLYVPHNTVHQHVNADPHDSLVLLSAQNRLFKLLGYDAVIYLEDAPEYARAQAAPAR
ncbi:MAG: cupin domain-containing protein [Armatimonadota bacterium]|nr:cupin domain-containing protein [Armatimonadota bacterium]